MEREEEPEFKGEEAQGAVEQDEELVILGAKEAPEVGPRELGVADRAGPKTGEVETSGTWPRGGACGQMPAGSPTPSRRCRGEYPRNYS